MSAEYLHPFEACGLGKAPYTYVGHEAKVFHAAPGAPGQPGGSCQYCFTAIVDHYYLRSADGQVFHVGSECIKKASRPGDRVLSDVEKAARAVKRERDATRLRARLDVIYARLDADPAFLTDQPHPKNASKTMRDWAEWMFAHSGAAGALRTVKAIEAVITSGDGLQ